MKFLKNCLQMKNIIYNYKQCMILLHNSEYLCMKYEDLVILCAKLHFLLPGYAYLFTRNQSLQHRA